MTAKFCLIAAASLLVSSAAAAADGPTDPQIAHIAYTAGSLDIEAAKLALKKSTTPAVREFASVMVRDHEAVNEKALALVNKLHVTPEPNAISEGLTKQAAETIARLEQLNGEVLTGPMRRTRLPITTRSTAR